VTDPDVPTAEPTVLNAVENTGDPLDGVLDAVEVAVSAEGQAPADQPDPGTQAELDLGLVSTGDVRVDAALAGLGALANLPVADHPGVFDDVHQGLHTALTELDED
jgi:hypothetical protein